MFRIVIATLIALVAAATPASPPERIDTEINAKIRQEENDHSQIMRTVHYLTDVYGPRLTGSPNYKAAAEWVIRQTAEWGMQNGHLEPWTFGHPGWLNERFAGFITSPVKDSLVGEVLAWTPSTKNGSRIEPIVRPRRVFLRSRLFSTSGRNFISRPASGRPEWSAGRTGSPARAPRRGRRRDLPP